MATLAKLINNNDRKNRLRSDIWQRSDIGLAEILRPRACKEPEICAITLKTHRGEDGVLTQLIVAHGSVLQSFDADASPEDVRDWYASNHEATQRRRKRAG